MRIDLNKNPNILREPKNYKDALARRAGILTLFEDTGYDYRENGLYKKATQQVHELWAAQLELEAEQEHAQANALLTELSPEEKDAEEVKKRALIAEYAARAPKEHIPVTEVESVGAKVAVNKRDEVLLPSEVRELQNA